MSYSVIIVAGGKGTRFSETENKLLYEFADGDTVINKTLQVFLNDQDCDEIVLVASKELINAYHKRYPFYGKMVITIGGATRQESVYNGLLALQGDKVLIHDGARPWVTIDDVHKVVDQLDTNAAVCLTAEVTDTIKTIQGDKISGTIDRATLRRALTPQGFHYSQIKACYQQAMVQKLQTTDDCQLYQSITNLDVKYIDATSNN